MSDSVQDRIRELEAERDRLRLPMLEREVADLRRAQVGLPPAELSASQQAGVMIDRHIAEAFPPDQASYREFDLVARTDRQGNPAGFDIVLTQEGDGADYVERCHAEIKAGLQAIFEAEEAETGPPEQWYTDDLGRPRRRYTWRDYFGAHEPAAPEEADDETLVDDDGEPLSTAERLAQLSQLPEPSIDDLKAKAFETNDLGRLLDLELQSRRVS